MNDAPAVEILTRELHGLLATMTEQSPDRISLQQTLRYTERSRCVDLTPGERAALMRVAAAHMRHAESYHGDATQDAALAVARRAMTAALFACCSG